MSSEQNIEIAVSYVKDINGAKIADFGTRMIMVPSVEKQNGLLELTTQSKQSRYHAGITSLPRHHSYGDENNSESRKETIKRVAIEKLATHHVDNDISENCSYKLIEGPIDLSSSNALKIETEEESTDTENTITVKVEDNIVDERKFMLQKNKQKKRKTTMFVDEEWAIEQVSDRIPKQTVNKKEEVLKAARSLFSKRTRTLYHWMYPDTSKGKLKAIVSAAWDTLSTTEKEFYVSQVLGRFGVPAGSLMVNPQLGGFQNRDITATAGLIASTSNIPSNELDITSSTTFQNSDNSNGMWARKRWRRHVNNEEYSSRLPHQHLSTVEVVDPEYDEDEFADDPELTTELLQFQRAMDNTE